MAKNESLSWKTEKRKVRDLIPYDKNPRRLTEEQKKHLTRSLEKFNLVEIPAVNTDGVIIAGHQRLGILTALGRKDEEIDVRVPSRKLTESELKEYNLRSNKNTGEWDIDVLMANFDIDLLNEVGFGMDTIPQEEPSVNNGMDDDTGLGQIFQLNNDAIFKSDTVFGFPEIRKDMLSDIIPNDIWVSGNVENPGKTMFLYGSNKIPIEAKGGVLAFYVDDTRFECVWNDCVKYVEKFINFGWGAVLSPDFSMWKEMPEAVQIWQTYRSRWCARYWQEAGIKIIPSLNFSTEKTLKWAFAGIPKNPPVVSVQCRTLHNIKEKENFIFGINAGIKQLEPENVIIYGGDKHIEEFKDEISTGSDLHFLKSWTQIRNEKRLVKGA